jgi:hypothetical protein
MARDKFKGKGYELRVVERERARRLVTIGPEHAFWSLEPGGLLVLPEPVEEALVRVQPPPGTTDAQVDAIRASLKAERAAAVRVLPWARAKDKAVPAKVVVHESASVRDVVTAIANKSPRRTELLPLLDEILTEVQL